MTRARMCTLDRLISSLLLEETSPWVLEKENECVSDDRDDEGAFMNYARRNPRGRNGFRRVLNSLLLIEKNQGDIVVSVRTQINDN